MKAYTDQRICSGIYISKTLASKLPNGGKSVLDAVTFLVNEHSVDFYKSDMEPILYPHSLMSVVNALLDNILPKEVRIFTLVVVSETSDGQVYVSINEKLGEHNVG